MKTWCCVCFSMFLTVITECKSGEVMEKIKKQGYVVCGVNHGVAGFSAPDENGKWSGLDVDVCRATAAAILGDESKVQYRPLSAKERFTALQSGEIDILARNTTWTSSRALSLGIQFVDVNYYDGQGFMVRKTVGVSSAKQLKGATVCANSGTTTELRATDFSSNNGLNFQLLTFDNPKETTAAYDAGRCDAMTADLSALSSQRFNLKNKNDHVILEDVISKEPLAPAVRQGDYELWSTVKWVMGVMVLAEELGVTSQNVDEMTKTGSQEIQRLLDAEDDFNKNLGVSAGWTTRIIKQVGNYGESFDRNIGKGSPIQLERGKNALWTSNGLMYAFPFR